MRSLSPEVTEGPRTDILQCVQRVPGVHLRDIERRTELSLGQVIYHLDRLERMGLISSTRDAGFRRYYPTRTVGRADRRVLAALRHEVPRHVALLLLAHPSSAHKDLQKRLGVAGSTLSFHLARLVASGVVAREPAGNANLYSLCEPELVRRELIYYRESFQDPRVDEYVRHELDRLSRAAQAGAGVMVGEGGRASLSTPVPS